MMKAFDCFKRSVVFACVLLITPNLTAMTQDATATQCSQEQWLKVYRITSGLFNKIDNLNQKQIIEKLSHMHRAICKLQPFQQHQFIQEYTRMLHEWNVLTSEFQDIAQRYKNLTAEQKNKILSAQEIIVKKMIDASPRKDEYLIIMRDFANNHANACKTAKAFSQECFNALKVFNAQFYDYCPFFLGWDDKEFINNVCWFWKTFNIMLKRTSLCASENELLWFINQQQDIITHLQVHQSGSLD